MGLCFMLTINVICVILKFVVPCSHRPLPRAVCTSQRMYRFAGVPNEAYLSSNTSTNYVVSRYSFGWSETQPILPKQSVNKDLSPLAALVTSKSQNFSTASLVGDEKIGVLLLNLGGPETLEDVQPFLFNLFADPVTLSFIYLFFGNKTNISVPIH